MNTVTFAPIRSSDSKKYAIYYQQSQTRIADMTFLSRYAWDVIFRTEIAFFEEFCLLISDGCCFTDPHVLMPMGDLSAEKLEQILDQISEVFAERNWQLKVMCIDEDKIHLFDELTKYHGTPVYDDDFSDYVYDAESLRTLSGNALHKKRNHFNKFIRTYPGYAYSRITENDADDCLALAREWCVAKDLDLENPKVSDYLMIKRLFDHFSELDIRGGIIRIEGIVRAFSIGGLGNHNCAHIHFEKADQSYDGIYVAINKLVLMHEFPEALTVNREEDLGIPGLAKAKQSYFPIEKVKKYKIWLNRES